MRRPLEGSRTRGELDDHTFYTQAISKFFGANNVWKNYFLVSAQWPLRGSSTNFPFYQPPIQANFPCTLRKSTMEAFGTMGIPRVRPGDTAVGAKRRRLSRELG